MSREEFVEQVAQMIVDKLKVACKSDPDIIPDYREVLSQWEDYLEEMIEKVLWEVIE